ncbi:MAG: MFS transporter [Asgard group archaeon]|nr:MFS transporter [Asgard group archaeon]
MSRLTKDDEVSLLTQEDPTPGRQLLTESERKRNIVFLTITALFASSANSIHFIFYSLYFREINNSEKLFGIIGTVTAFVAIIGLVLADYLNGLLGYKRVFIIAQILIAASFTFFIFRPNKIYWIIIAVMILSLAFSLNESPYNIILTETAGEKKKGTISSIVAFFGRFGEVIVSGLIFIVTILMGVEYTNNERSNYYLYSAIIVALIAIGVIFIVTDPLRKIKEKQKEIVEKSNELKEEINTEEDLIKEKKTGFIAGFIETFKDRWVLRVAITFFFDALLWSLALGVYLPGLQDEELFMDFALNDMQTSLLILITSGAVLVTMYLGRFVDKIGAKFFLFISEICGLIWAVLTIIYTYNVQHFWIIILSRIALGISIALWIPSTIALFTNVESERKSKVYNSIAIFRSIGWLPGGFIAGFIYEGIVNSEGLPTKIGFLTPMFILVGGMLILLPLFFTLPNRPSDMKNSRKSSKNRKSR